MSSVQRKQILQLKFMCTWCVRSTWNHARHHLKIHYRRESQPTICISFTAMNVTVSTDHALVKCVRLQQSQIDGNTGCFFTKRGVEFLSTVTSETRVRLRHHGSTFKCNKMRDNEHHGRRTEHLDKSQNTFVSSPAFYFTHPGPYISRASAG
jgi:hypothetical protein